MQNIEQQAMSTYQENLTYFEKSHPELYKKLLTLETAIQDGYYIEKYSLEYMAEGYFDIQELSTGTSLYGENSYAYSDYLVATVNTKKTGGIFKAQNHVDFSPDMVETIDKSELSFHNALWATIKLIDYTRCHSGYKDAYMINVSKCIFLDLGLGLHIEGIINKLQTKIIYLKEQNIEILRLSMFVINYQKIFSDKSLYISTNDDQDEQIFLQFLDHGDNYNLNIKYIPFMKKYEEKVQALQNYVLSQDFISYGYSAKLLRYIDAPKYLVAGKRFLNINAMYNDKEDNIFTQKPILFLFSGPSTSKNIDWIKEHHKKFIIVSPLSTCRFLNHYNISPHIVVHIDPGKETTEYLFEGLDDATYFKNSLILLSSNMHPKIVEKFNKDNVYFIEQGTTYKQGFGSLTAPSVGEYSYALFLVFGVKMLFMIGIDLALDKDTMKSHNELHPDKSQGKIDTSTASLDVDSAMTYIKGNFSDLVPTLCKFILSIQQLEYFTSLLKSDFNHIYNLSDGAYLEGAKPLHVKDFNWEDFEELNPKDTHTQIKSFLSDISSNNLRDIDKENLKYQLKEAQKLEKIIKKFQKKTFLNHDVFLASISKLYIDLSDIHNLTKSDITEVYHEYFQIILSYIYDFFNTENLSHKNHHIKKINLILSEQLLKISNLYIKKIKEYIN